MATAKRSSRSVPTVEELVGDELTSLSLQHWAGPIDQLDPFDPALVDKLYSDEISSGRSRVMILELSRYLELYLWPNFTPECSDAYVKSIIYMVNEKFRENVPEPWACFSTRTEAFPEFFSRALDLKTSKRLSNEEDTAFVVFLINCYQSNGVDFVRKQCLKLTYLPLWLSVNPKRVDLELEGAPPSVHKRWSKLLKRESRSKKRHKGKKSNSSSDDAGKTFFPFLLKQFIHIVEDISTDDDPRIVYCERFAELLIDLMAQLTTRRFFHLLLSDMHVVVRAQLSWLFDADAGSLFSELVDMLRFYETFEINNYTGSALSDAEMTEAHCSRLGRLQRLAFRQFPEDLRELALSNIGGIESAEGLRSALKLLSDEQLMELCIAVALIPPENYDGPSTREFLLSIITFFYEKRHSQLDVINETGIYPTEEILWDDNMVPSSVYDGERTLALPKLNLQFLTFHDYLLRNFNLFRLGAANDIREDLADAVRRVNPRKAHGARSKCTFEGWARMALPIGKFSVVKVKRPHLGERKPSVVRAHVEIDLSPYQGRIHEEWDSLKLHDVLYLLTIRSPVEKGAEFDASKDVPQRYGVVHCRGCEVYKLLDESEQELNAALGPAEKPVVPKGNKRTICVWMDSAQYLKDTELSDDDVYQSFNLVVRRKPKENNFKAVLSTIRDLMNNEFAVPPWLHDLFLGYTTTTKPEEEEEEEDGGGDGVRVVRYNDTFVSRDHVEQCFPTKSVVFQPRESDAIGSNRFSLEFPRDDSSTTIVAKEIPIPSIGPVAHHRRVAPKHNPIRFTSKQVEAISSAMRHGLTLVVGPPGTGKTDVAVQIASNLYHNNPSQRTVIITHSNQALNQIFEKIMHLDVDERHLMRLGHGQRALETEKDFGKYGRVDHFLQRRLHNLSQADKLAKSLGVKGDVGWSCESAAQFFSMEVKPRWDAFESYVADNNATMEEEDGEEEEEEDGAFVPVDGLTASDVEGRFPFAGFFSEATSGAGLGEDAGPEDVVRNARSCWRYITSVFEELEEARPLELLRSAKERANYLMTKQARIVAMTCTHAALKRHELVRLGFHYDNLLMEEAAQILEIETFIPMLLQQHRVGEPSRLKRVTLIGDHNQLPPVVKNVALQKYSHLDQSLFSRFIRLGVPHVSLDAQGRCRPSLAKLFNWRYADLGNLPIIESHEDFQGVNAGFLHEYQLIDVPDHHGKGETAPNPYFYQNLGEAEYIVATFMYMRLLGYPAEKISVLTSYNGQKHLLRDVFTRRCASQPMFGMPRRISTVDRFQGQQNDYILLSLVRTKTVGHIRDVRRLIVAMSRARLGLYVFCRKSVFENCYELTKVFDQLKGLPHRLNVIPQERYGASTLPKERTTEDHESASTEISSLEELQALVVSMMSHGGGYGAVGGGHGAVGGGHGAEGKRSREESGTHEDDEEVENTPSKKKSRKAASSDK